MLIDVKLFATFREGRFAKKRLEIPDGSRLDCVLDQLNIQSEEVGILLVNGRNVPKEYRLLEDDSISVFPLIAGG